MTDPIDFGIEAALKALQDGKSVTGKDGVLTPLIKQLTEAALNAELDQHLEQDDRSNRKNGFGKKRSNQLPVSLNSKHPETVLAHSSRSSLKNIKLTSLTI